MFDEGTISGRLTRAEAFRRYLDTQWVNLENAADVFNWRPKSSMLFSEIENIKSRVDRVRIDRNAALRESLAQ